MSDETTQDEPEQVSKLHETELQHLGRGDSVFARLGRIGAAEKGHLKADNFPDDLPIGSYVQYLSSIFELSELLHSAGSGRISALPFRVLIELDQALSEIEDLLRLTDQWVAGDLEQQDRRRAMKLAERNHTWFRVLSSVAHYLSTKEYRRTRDAARALQVESDQLDAVVGEIDRLATEARNALEAARAAAEVRGVDAYVRRFRKQSAQYNKSATTWLHATMGIGAAMLGLVATTFFLTEPFLVYRVGGEPVLSSVGIQWLFAKVLLAVLLLFALTFSLRNYRTLRHLATLDAHRQSALSTFRALSEVAGIDDATRNLILARATEVVFSAQPSGYLGTEHEMPHIGGLSSAVAEELASRAGIGKGRTK